jgi:hydroxymethylpyrimidine/phosphomethylpyrimidine kinase
MRLAEGQPVGPGRRSSLDLVTPRVALTIAGSDSGGGAGLQADLKTFAAHGLHGASAVTAVTAQNTASVLGVVALEPSFVVAQVEAVLEDMSVDGVKTGMLANAGIVAAVAELAAAGSFPPLVVDPVLVSSTGRPLMDEGGVDAYRSLLIPHADVLTPNLREAAVLTGHAPEELGSVDAMADAAGALRALGPRLVVVKGGHLDRVGGSGSPDVVAGPEGIVVLPGERVRTANDHGTGCSLSAAIAANLALGAEPLAAVRRAKRFVATALARAADWRLGAGHGPIDHLALASRSGTGDGSADPVPAGQDPGAGPLPEGRGQGDRP